MWQGSATKTRMPASGTSPEHAVHALELGASRWVLPSQAVDCAQGMLFMHGTEQALPGTAAQWH